MYALRDKSFDYINPDVFCISNENFFKALNLSFNIIMKETPPLYTQPYFTIYNYHEYFRLATLPPYFEYNNINDIKFHRMLITPPVAINGGVGWFYSYELAKIFETLFGNYDTGIPVRSRTAVLDELSSKRSTRLTQMHRSTLEGNK